MVRSVRALPVLTQRGRSATPLSIATLCRTLGVSDRFLRTAFFQSPRHVAAPVPTDAYVTPSTPSTDFDPWTHRVGRRDRCPPWIYSTRAFVGQLPKNVGRKSFGNAASGSPKSALNDRLAF